MNTGTKTALVIATTIFLTGQNSPVNANNITFAEKTNTLIRVAAEDIGPDIGTDHPEELYTGTLRLMLDLKNKKPENIKINPTDKHYLQQLNSSCKLYSVKKQKRVAEVTIGCISGNPDPINLEVISSYKGKVDKTGIVDELSYPAAKPATNTWKHVRRTKTKRFSETRQSTRHTIILKPGYDSTKPPAADFAFLQYQPDRQTPVSWNKCLGPITVHINFGPVTNSLFVETLKKVLEDLSKESGLTLQLAEQTSFEPQTYDVNDPNVKSNLNITVAVVDKQTNTFFTENVEKNPTVVGWGGSEVKWTENMELVYLNGMTVLDQTYVQYHLKQANTGFIYTLLAHELGHVVGLGHVDNRFQIMYPVFLYPAKGLQKGDKTGLNTLKNVPCQNPKIIQN